MNISNNEFEKNNISFFIPAWNCENMIGDALNSIIKTNYKDGDEIVIVNDASTDNTPLIIKNYAKKYNFIKIIHHKKNSGCATSRNTAIKSCKNEILFCLDSDNILIPNSIQRLKNYMLKFKADSACFGGLNYFRDGKTKKITHRWIFKNGLHTLADVLFGPITPIASGNYMLTKESWKKAGGYMESTRLLDTWTFGIRQLATGTKMIIMPNSFYFHRCGYESNYIHYTKKGVNGHLLRFDALEPFFRLIEERDVEYIKNNQNTWFSDLNIHPIKIKNEKYGKNGRIVQNFKYRITKIIVRIPLFLKFYQKFKKYIIFKKFKKDFYDFKKLSKKDNRFNVNWKDKRPCMDDNTSTTKFDSHYIYHPAWAARILAKTKPEKHIDISSTLHFCSIISAFIPTEFYDFRPAKLSLKNLTSKQIDSTSLPFKANSINSLSCMHTVEHIGLGRYGEKVNSKGDLNAIKELIRVLAISGNLIFAVPVGKPKIIFNAHRIYSYKQILKYFNDLELLEFTLITDNGDFISNAREELADIQNYGCGCFWFKKIT